MKNKILLLITNIVTLGIFIIALTQDIILLTHLENYLMSGPGNWFIAIIIISILLSIVSILIGFLSDLTNSNWLISCIILNFIYIIIEQITTYYGNLGLFRDTYIIIISLVLLAVNGIYCFIIVSNRKNLKSTNNKPNKNNDKSFIKILEEEISSDN